jgi:hypothetical protein
MICNKKLEALFDAALRAMDEPKVKHDFSSPMEYPGSASGELGQSDEGNAFDERDTAPQESISFAPAYWKTAL